MPTSDRLSPEVEVLDQLGGGPLSLTIILSIFHDPARAQRALRILAGEGCVEFIGKPDESAPLLPEWQVRQILDSLAQRPDAFIHVYLRLTDRGYDKFANDSQGFFEKLFSK